MMMVVMVVTMMVVVMMVVSDRGFRNTAIKCHHNVFGRQVARKNVMYTALSLLQCINCISQLLLFYLIVCYLE